MATPTTFDTDTELSSVNSILASIGQSPVTTLDYTNPEISFVKHLLDEANTDVQNEGWVFNRELHYPFVPNSNNQIVIPNNILRMDIYENDIYRSSNVIKRDGKLYDKEKHSYEFTKKISADIVWKFPFEDLPSVFKRYITYRAAVRAASNTIEAAITACTDLASFMALYDVPVDADGNPTGNAPINDFPEADS